MSVSMPGRPSAEEAWQVFDGRIFRVVGEDVERVVDEPVRFGWGSRMEGEKARVNAISTQWIVAGERVTITCGLPGAFPPPDDVGAAKIHALHRLVRGMLGALSDPDPTYPMSVQAHAQVLVFTSASIPVGDRTHVFVVAGEGPNTLARAELDGVEVELRMPDFLVDTVALERDTFESFAAYLEQAPESVYPPSAAEAPSADALLDAFNGHIYRLVGQDVKRGRPALCGWRQDHEDGVPRPIGVTTAFEVDGFAVRVDTSNEDAGTFAALQPLMDAALKAGLGSDIPQADDLLLDRREVTIHVRGRELTFDAFAFANTIAAYAEVEEAIWVTVSFPADALERVALDLEDADDFREIDDAFESRRGPLAHD